MYLREGAGEVRRSVGNELKREVAGCVGCVMMCVCVIRVWVFPLIHMHCTRLMQGC